MAHRYFSGYMTRGTQRRTWETRAGSKKRAHDAIKETYPDWRVYVVASYLRKERRGRG